MSPTSAAASISSAGSRSSAIRIARRYRAEDQDAAGHAHLPMIEEGWGRPFKDGLAWLERTVDER